MTHKQFFATLEKFYYNEEYPVKYWLQCTTFSFSIYHKDDAFHGKSIFDSQIYGWNHSSNMIGIIEDIKKERDKIIAKEKEPATKRNIEL